MARLNLLPDPRFVPLHYALDERMRLSADAINAENFQSFLDPMLHQVIEDGFAYAGAHEGTVWMADQTREHLIPVLNTGPKAAAFVGKFKQPLRAGLVSMVFTNEQPFNENAVYDNSMQDKTLDRQLGFVTCAMIVVPFYFARALRGVVSCVQLKDASRNEPDPPGFPPNSLRRVQFTASVVGKLIEHRLLAVAVGWEREGMV